MLSLGTMSFLPGALSKQTFVHNIGGKVTQHLLNKDYWPLETMGTAYLEIEKEHQ